MVSRSLPIITTIWDVSSKNSHSPVHSLISLFVCFVLYSGCCGCCFAVVELSVERYHSARVIHSLTLVCRDKR